MSLVVYTREQVAAEVARLGVSFEAHDEGWTNTLGWAAETFGWKAWRQNYWLTLGKTIHHPASVKDPLGHFVIVMHELVHVRQQAKMGVVPWTAKYCSCWSFRWEQEREAYLIDLRAGRLTVGEVVTTLRKNYGVKTPVDRMVRWFNAALAAEATP
jgi:hypothetical protein